MSERKEGLWAGRIKRWLFVAVMLVLIGGGGAGFLQSIQDWPSEPVYAVWEGLAYLLAAQYIGAVFAALILRSNDAELFAYTPMTLKLYLRRSIRRVLPALLVTFGLYPVLLIAALPEDMQANTLFVANLYLLCILPLLLSIGESIVATNWILAPFFVPRHLLYFGIIFVVPFLLAGWGIYRIPADTISIADEWFAKAAGFAPTHILLMILSPLSALVLVLDTPFATPVLWLLLAWMLAIAVICVARFVRFVRTENAEHELQNFTEWLEQRESEEDAWEQQDLAVERELELDANTRHSVERDLAWESDRIQPHGSSVETATSGSDHVPTRGGTLTAGLAFQGDLSPENQIVRHMDHQVVLPELIEAIGPLRRFLRKPAALLLLRRVRVFYALLLVVGCLFYLVEADNPLRRPVAGCVLAVILFWLTYRRPFRLRWVITCGLAVPLRWRRLILRDYWHSLKRDFLLDALAVCVLALLLLQPLWFAPIWWAFFRLSSLSAYLVVMMDFLRKAGRPWPIRLTTIAAFFLRPVQFWALFFFLVPAYEAEQVSVQMLLTPLLVIAGAELGYVALSLVTAAVALRGNSDCVVGNFKWPTPFVSNAEQPGVYVK